MTRMITDLGDAAFLLPSAVIFALHLLLSRSARVAGIWLSALLLCAIFTIWAKLIFRVCGDEVLGLQIVSPSGHAALSTTFYVCGALVMSADREWRTRTSLMLAGVLVVVAIGASRVRIGAHTPAEVFAGWAIGLCCIAWFAALFYVRKTQALPWAGLAGVIIAVSVLMHGRHIGIESRLAQWVETLQLAGYGELIACPVGTAPRLGEVPRAAMPDGS